MVRNKPLSESYQLACQANSAMTMIASFLFNIYTHTVPSVQFGDRSERQEPHADWILIRVQYLRFTQRC
jgi:hypothetical protein